MHSQTVLIRIVCLHEQGFNNSKISQILRLPHSTVIYTVRKHINTGLIAGLGGDGRKPSLDSEDLCLILRAVSDNSKVHAGEIVKRLVLENNTAVTPQTVRNYLRSSGYACRPACKKPFIKESNKEARIKLCTKWAQLPKVAWSTVIYSDECKFELWRSHGSTRVWRKPDTRFEAKNILPTVKYGGSVMVWGCMAANGVGKLVFIDGKMDRYAYVRILSENLASSVEKLDFMTFIFQQDNDPKHTEENHLLGMWRAILPIEVYQDSI
jgi:transposase